MQIAQETVALSTLCMSPSLKKLRFHFQISILLGSAGRLVVVLMQKCVALPNDQGKTCQDIHKMKGEKLPPV